MIKIDSFSIPAAPGQPRQSKSLLFKRKLIGINIFPPSRRLQASQGGREGGRGREEREEREERKEREREEREEREIEIERERGRKEERDKTSSCVGGMARSFAAKAPLLER